MQPTCQRIVRAAVAGGLAFAGLAIAAQPAAAAPDFAAAPTPKPAVMPADLARNLAAPDIGLSPYGLNLGTLVLGPGGALIRPGNIRITSQGATVGDLTRLPGVQLPSNIVKLAK